VTALDTLAALHELCQQLPEQARGSADELLELLTLAELARTERKADRLQRLLRSRTISPKTRAHELAAVADLALRSRLTNNKRIAGVLNGGGWELTVNSVKEYRQILTLFQLVPLPKPAPPDLTEDEIRRLRAGASKRALSNGWCRPVTKSGRTEVPSYDD